MEKRMSDATSKYKGFLLAVNDISYRKVKYMERQIDDRMRNQCKTDNKLLNIVLLGVFIWLWWVFLYEFIYDMAARILTFALSFPVLFVLLILIVSKDN